MSSRALVEGLPSPFPLGLALPGLYQGDDLCQRFTAGLDEVIAPVHAVLDCLDAYLDPMLSPEDFATWLATWVGVAMDEHWSMARQREVVRRAVELYSWRGTRRGIVEVVRLYVGVDPEVTDSGAVAASEVPDAELPGEPVPFVRVVVTVEDADGVDARRLSALVELLKPAHAGHEVEVRQA